MFLPNHRTGDSRMFSKINKKLAFLVAAVAFGASFAVSSSFAGDPQWCSQQCRGLTGAALEKCYWGCVNNANGPR